MAHIMKNKIPSILKAKNLNATEFHHMFISGGKETRLSYPKALELATKETIPEKMEIGTLKKAALVLGTTFDNLIEIENV